MKNQGADSIQRCHLTCIGNLIVEIRRSFDRLISTMGFPILVRWHLYTESGSWLHKPTNERPAPDPVKEYSSQPAIKRDTNFILRFCTLHITSRSFLYLTTYMYNSKSIVVDHKHMRDTVFGNLSWWPTNYKTPIDKVSVQYIDLCHFWSKQNLVKNLRTCAAYSSIPRFTWIMVVRVR